MHQFFNGKYVLNISIHTPYGGDSETYDLALSHTTLGSGWFGW